MGATTRPQMRTVARDHLLREAPFAMSSDRAAGDGSGNGDGLTLSGHAAVFNRVTVIDSWEGRFKEQCGPGCFRKTFRERTPVLQFDHGRHPLVGSIPIGKLVRAEEDDIGADVEGRLHDNWLTQPVRDAIASESVTGMSFRFTVVRDEWVDPDGKKITDEEELLRLLWASWDAPEDELLLRTLKELKVPELGPVVFPAYEETDVGVRSGVTTIDLSQLRSDPAERTRLARALWLAEDEDHEDVPGAAPVREDHSVPDDDAPPAGHPSASTPASDTSSDDPERSEADGAVQDLLARMSSTLDRIHERGTI